MNDVGTNSTFSQYFLIKYLKYVHIFSKHKQCTSRTSPGVDSSYITVFLLVTVWQPYELIVVFPIL